MTALEVESTALNLEEAQARTAGPAEAVARAEENLRMVRELYGSGLATNSQGVDAEVLRVGAPTNRDNARCDVQRALPAAARNRRALAVGRGGRQGRTMPASPPCRCTLLVTLVRARMGS